MSVLLLLGPPGAGRSVLTNRLAQVLDFAWVPARELLRSAALEPGGSAVLLRLHLEAGAPVPAALAMEVVTQHLQRVPWANGAVLDGFPQDLKQAKALDKWLAAQGRRPSRALRLELPQVEVLRRLSGRRHCRSCPHGRYNIFDEPALHLDRCTLCRAPLHQRLRDREDVVLQRIRRRNVEELPLELYYREAGLLERIDASGDSASVLARIVERVGSTAPPLDRRQVA